MSVKHPLTPELITQVCERILRGCHRQTAFALFGVPQSTWNEWVTIGNCVREGRKQRRAVEAEKAALCEELVHRLNQVEAALEDKLVFDIVNGSNDDRRWYLKTRHNRRYNNNPRASYEEDNAGAVRIDARELLTERLTTLLDRWREDQAAKGSKT